MFCSRCGTSLADGSQFCIECGHTVEASFPVAPAPSGETSCAKCNKSIFPGSRYCANCGTPASTSVVITVGDGGSAAAAATAYEPLPWQYRPTRTRRRLLVWLAVLAAVGAIGWIAATDNPIRPLVKEFVITAHSEVITDGSIAIKPHGFISYKVNVPEGAIDVAVNGQFDASGRAENDVQVLLLTESEFVIWQSGYATSPFYDSGRVARDDLQASLPSRSGTYYLIFSNKPSRLEKTVHISAGLHYDTWLPDSLISLKQKVWAWFE